MLVASALPLAAHVQPPAIRGVQLLVEPVLDGPVLLFSAAVTGVAALLFGVVPALRASQLDLRGMFSGEGIAGTIPRRRGRQFLMAGQAAASVLLVLVAALLVRSFLGARGLDPALDGRAVAVGVELGLHGFDETRGRRFFDDLLRGARALPGVVSASLAAALPVSTDVHGGRSVALAAYGHGPAVVPPGDARSVPVSPGYLPGIGLRMVAGRDFSESDTGEAPPVTVLGEALARRLFGGSSAVGQHVVEVGSSRVMAVIGVVADVMKYSASSQASPATCYVPFAQQYSSAAYVVVRTGPDPHAVVDPLARLVSQIEPAVVVAESGTVRDLFRKVFYTTRLLSALMTTLGVASLALAVVGVYGVVAYQVSRRAREIGIRMALGADRRAVVWMATRDAFVALLAGGLCGGLAALAAGRVIARLLFGIRPGDPVTFAVLPVALALVGLLACYLPARRASRMSPLTALRQL